MALMNFSAFDLQMMDIALVLARRALGTTAPNPAVGAVIADEASGEVIARGATQPGGRPHAEPVALQRAGARARGATLYVTLEPCAHHGKTPPCADAVVAAGLGRVVVGVEDPDPRTKGDGIRRLRAAGIAVEVGCRGAAARWTTLGHILRVTERRPFVQLKMAVARDGTVPRGAGGQARMVTGAEARAAAHLLRAEADAILVGSGTVRDDDPELTCRLPGLAARSPIRVVLSRALDLSPTLKLVRTAREVPTWVLTGEEADAAQVRRLEDAGVRVFRIDGANAPPPCGEGAGVGGSPTADAAVSLPPHPPPQGGRAAAVRGTMLPIRSVLARLADEGVTRLMVEGGPHVWASLASQGLADEVALFRAGGADAELPPQAAALAARLAPGLDLALTDTRRLGADTMTIFRVGPRAEEASAG